MPRLDAARVRAWRDLQSIVPEIERRIDEDLRAEWAVPLGWFDVLAALRELDGRARPQDVASVMRIPASSLSRRLDRLEEEGWVRRHRDVDPDDHRAVEVELTRRGRALWREMNVSYRRSLQARFAIALTDRDIQGLTATAQTLSDHTSARTRRTVSDTRPVSDTGCVRRTSPRSPWRSGRGCRAASTSTSGSARRCRAATPRRAR